MAEEGYVTVPVLVGDAEVNRYARRLEDELAEARERADHWQHQFHVMGETAYRAETELRRVQRELSELEANYDACQQYVAQLKAES